jgi:hypothetical protein
MAWYSLVLAPRPSSAGGRIGYGLALIGTASGLYVEPLSAQAETPSRPSGDAKKQEAASNIAQRKGSAGRGPKSRPAGRADMVAHRHHLPSPISTRSPIKVNEA